MSRLTNALRRFTHWLLHGRIGVPLCRPTIPVWLIGGLALILPPVTGAALVATNQPIFCSSCHEMSLHYATWSQSAHRSVGCEECHVMPGAVSMFKSKLKAIRQVREHAAGDVRAAAIQGHVPDANCRRCHGRTRELVTYHGLKITHAAHWQMGVGCTYCHDRVAHGPKWLYSRVSSTARVKSVATPYKYTPTMEGCYRCHDGKRAPNECSTCHVTMGERRPSTFDPAWVQAHREEVKRSGEQDCQRCHGQDFCNNCHRAADPHPGDWLAQHPQVAKANPDRCPACHQAPLEAKPKQAADLEFCQACHSLRREHRQADWQRAHGAQALADPAYCQRCHQPSWCSDCHATSRPHPPEWRARHASAANSRPENCRTCHADQFCQACHQAKQSVPASHQGDWLQAHKNAAAAGGQSCNTCHKPAFCETCHAKHPPASHGRLWLKQHGEASQANGSSCLLCHRQSQCNACHGVTMPHPKGWTQSHPKAAAKQAALCQQCHRQESCAACHRGALPATHGSKDWLAQHGRQSQRKGAQCTLCHRPDFCTACHGVKLPHPQDWAKSHGATAKAGSETCARCHQQASCDQCHGVAMPHPATWVAEHGAKATADAASCGKCHGPGRRECSTCHRALPPASHRDEGWAKGHGVVGATKMALCAMCHGQNACADCHARRQPAAAAAGKP